MRPPRTPLIREERSGWSPAPGPIVGLRVVQTGVVYPIPRDGAFELGSELERHIAILNDESVSRLHCRFEWREPEHPETSDDELQLWIVNLSKSNGTFVDDKLTKELRLVDGCIIRVGRTSLVAFSELSQARRTRNEWLLGTNSRFRAAVDRAFSALKEWRVVVLAGERGTGRRSVVRALHENVCTPSTPFCEVLCIEESPGARGPIPFVRQKLPPLRAQASGGLLYFHELQAQHHTMQAWIARNVLSYAAARELRCIISASEPCAIDVWPASEVEEITLPSLRERGPSDLALLVDHFLVQTLGADRELVAIPPEIERALAVWHWPGNVAELATTIRRLGVVLRHGGNLAAAAHELGMVRSTLHEWFVRRDIPLRTADQGAA